MGVFFSLFHFVLKTNQIEKVKAATIAAGNWPAAGSSSTDVKNPPPPPFPAHVDDEDEEGLC